MAINGVTVTGFSPYAIPAGVNRGGSTEPATGAQIGRREAPPSTQAQVQGPAQDVAAAVKQDAASRAALVASAKAPEGVDQELWSVLTREERSFFVKAGAMGPLTYARSSAPQGPQTAPLVRGGRLDIRA